MNRMDAILRSVEQMRWQCEGPAFEMKNQMNIKTKIEFKRIQAVRAIEAYWKLDEANPEEFRASAKRHNSIPIDLRRDKKGRDKQFELLNDQGIVIKRRGRIREDDTLINKEVETSYHFLLGIQTTLHINRSVGSEKFILDAFKLKTPPSATSLKKFTELTLDSEKKWRPWLMMEFLVRHKDHPEENEELKSLVLERVKQSDSTVTPAERRNQIKQDFRKAISRLAKQYS